MRRVRARAFAAIALLAALACAPPRGGWDVAALRAREPALELGRGQRLGDLVPFPNLEQDRLQLVLCRFPTDRAIRWRIDGSAGSRAWAIRAAAGVAAALPEVALSEGPDAQIEIEAIEGPSVAGPAGLGDTVAECDLEAGPQGRPRGWIRKARIRMRHATRDARGQLRPAPAEEWVGALMHEFAHALGFSGHARVGRSMLVKEQSTLRAWGRRALRGQAARDETLAALYRVAAGSVLGERAVASESEAVLLRLAALRRDLARAEVAETARRAIAGDIEARLEWEYSDGTRLSLLFPDWAGSLRAGTAIEVVWDARRQRVGASFLDGRIQRVGARDQHVGLLTIAQ